MDNLFGDFDFELLKSPDFKEDSVREELILPILKALGYTATSLNRIVRSKKLHHPFVSIGSKEVKLTNFPDYLFEVNGKFAWVLDAKGPNEEVLSGDNRQQAYFYAIHPEINVHYYALCNGKEFVLFHVSQNEAVLYFPLVETGRHWNEIEAHLTPNAFNVSKVLAVENRRAKDFDYLSRKPLSEIKGISKQSSKRHYGVHGYFTKQAYQIVHAYIQNFTKPNDLVLDPFGGTGVTVVEALMLGRRGIHIDLNPLSIFFVKNLITPIRFHDLEVAFERVGKEFKRLRPKSEDEVELALGKYPYPKNVQMDSTSDFTYLDEVFSREQLAELALLKHIIKQEKDLRIRDVLLLMFSSSLNKFNLTYHASAGRTEGRGNSSIFAMYRYRKAPTPGKVGLWTTFSGKLNKVINAKREMAALITEQTELNAQIVKGTATNLNFISDESVDYIYTDPPYGKKIQYLDLSIMWNAWLDLEVTEEDYELEAIEGGEHNKTKEDYSNLIADSIKEMFRVLKFDRWMSFVFQHQDPAYWHLIVEAAEKAGFEYAGAVRQNNGQSSFKKRQHPFTVLSGQLIISFKKVRNPKSIMKAQLGGDITDLIHQAIEDIIAHHSGATIEEINDEIVIKFMELNILDLVAKKYKDLSEFLAANFDYDNETKKYNLKKETKFRANIPVEVRIKYYIISMMRRLAREGQYPHIDDIYLEIMPLLKNGKTPEEQTILNVLQTIAAKTGEDQWKLFEAGQGELFTDF
jgi:DNA modification methylase